MRQWCDDLDGGWLLMSYSAKQRSAVRIYDGFRSCAVVAPPYILNVLLVFYLCFPLLPSSFQMTILAFHVANPNALLQSPRIRVQTLVQSSYEHALDPSAHVSQGAPRGVISRPYAHRRPFPFPLIPDLSELDSDRSNLKPT